MAWCVLDLMVGTDGSNKFSPTEYFTWKYRQRSERLANLRLRERCCSVEDKHTKHEDIFGQYQEENMLPI